MWGPTRSALIALGHDAQWVGDLPADPGDIAVLARAHEQNRILVTMDKDFGELAVLHKHPHRGIVRLMQLLPHQQAQAAHEAIIAHADQLSQGAIVTVERDRLRIRMPEAAD